MSPDGADVRGARMLLVRLDNIGDVILLGPAIRALREAHPTAHLSLLASPAGSQVGPLLPWLDEVITLRALWQDASGALPFDPAREWQVIETLRHGAFDTALIFTSFSQSPFPPAYACYLAGIPTRVGMAPDFGGGVLSTWVRSPDPTLHQADRNLHLLQAIGVPVRDRSLGLVVAAGVAASADGLLASVGIDPGGRFIAVAPGASAAARRYPADRFAAATRSLAARSGLPVVLLGSEREAPTIAPLAALADLPGGSIVSLVGRTTVPELAGLISRAAVLIANDSGPMHIADAFRVPSVILYSGTELVSQWAPRSSPATLLRRETPCTPCHLFECPIGLPCLDIDPDEVVDSALALLPHVTAPAAAPASVAPMGAAA